ncbi:dehydrogenase/reductase SDR family member 12 isoform X2 [Stegostoma tigrinum]|uniref:dehydrogenase/reductase SDR family member 12 isoform X2 n=1 Tax=Stegostoma tigrinum TaxID=3053191 RepID=UPI002870016A|nr:dehydrogenase/reductase SDR family member 12 isoform X2 [Stegostoma tigrinum]
MSFYRNGVWFLKGLREYTKSGYEAAAQQFSLKDLDVDVSGRCFLITGANSGIGKATALEIAKRGGVIHLVCRNKERAEEAKAEIVKEANNEEVFVHILDMSRPKMIWEFADAFQQSNDKLNVLITVSSGGMLVQKLNVDDLQFEKGRFDGTMAYAQNKRQQVVMTEQWAKMYKNIHFSSMHPGWADTEAVRSSMPDFHTKMKNRLRTPSQGADTLVWLAISNVAAQQPSGLYFQDRKPVSTHLLLAQTRATAAEEEKLMNSLAEIAMKHKPGSG